MPDLGIFLLLVIAIAIGWLMGRSAASTSSKESKESLPESWHKGLNYLINESSDQGIETFVSALEVNGSTLNTHLALGNLMRRRGEVERAIRIHQNLLGRSTLSVEQQHSAHFELARDYQKAGLLDRAERLLLEVVEGAPERKRKALVTLTDIYDEEREWQEAIAAGEQILPKRRIGTRSRTQQLMAKRLAHYACELSEAASEDDKERFISQALGYDRGCVRASLLEAEQRLRQSHPKRAIKILERVLAQQAQFVPVLLPVLARAYEALDDPRAFQRHLNSLLEQCDSTSVAILMADNLERERNDSAARAVLSNKLSLRPTVRGTGRLLEMYIEQADESTREALAGMQDLIRQLGEAKPIFRCDNCGFSGRQLHWQCPSCRRWETVSPIRGVDGD